VAPIPLLGLEHRVRDAGPDPEGKLSEVLGVCRHEVVLRKNSSSGPRGGGTLGWRHDGQSQDDRGVLIHKVGPGARLSKAQNPGRSHGSPGD